MEEIRYNFLSPLHFACADDELRPNMECVYFQNGHAYATNAHVAIKQSLEHYCTVVNKDLLEGRCFYRDSFKDIFSFDIVAGSNNP